MLYRDYWEAHESDFFDALHNAEELADWRAYEEDMARYGLTLWEG